MESEMLYLVIYPEKENYTLNRKFFQNARNSLTKLIPEAQRWSEAVKIIDLSRNTDGSIINIYMNAFTQQEICYLTKKS